MDGDALWRRVADLCWTQHGGSGFGFTLSEVLELDWHRFEWFHGELERRRQDEYDALRKAHGR